MPTADGQGRVWDQRAGRPQGEPALRAVQAAFREGDAGRSGGRRPGASVEAVWEAVGGNADSQASEQKV